MTYPRSARPLRPHADDLYVSPTPTFAYWWLTLHVRDGAGRALNAERAQEWACDRARRPYIAIRRVLVVVPASTFDAAVTRSAVRLLLVRAAFDERVPVVLVIVGRANPRQTVAAQGMVDGLAKGASVPITLRRELTRTDVDV